MSIRQGLPAQCSACGTAFTSNGQASAASLVFGKCKACVRAAADRAPKGTQGPAILRKMFRFPK